MRKNIYYQKEKSIAKSIVKFAPYYKNMPKGQQQKIAKQLKELNSTILGFILEELEDDMTYQEFFYLVEDMYIRKFATNDTQRKFLKESIEYKMENSKKKEITIDTYNEGKHCDKFKRVKSKSGKRRKGKAFAKVRVKEINFS